MTDSGPLITESNIKPSNIQRNDNIYKAIDTETIRHPDLILGAKNERIKLLKAYINQLMRNRDVIIIPKAIIQIIYEYDTLSAVFGCYMFSGSYNPFKKNKDEYGKYVYSLELRSDLTFLLNVSSSRSRYHNAYGYVEKGYIYQMKGIIQIRKYNKYDLLFINDTFLEDCRTSSSVKALFQDIFIFNKSREKIYQQHIIKLYKSENKLSMKQIKKAHKQYVQTRNRGKDKKENKKSNKDHVQLTLQVLTRKILDDIRNNKLDINLYNNKSKKNNIKVKTDAHSIYKYLCRHFKVKPLPMSLGEICVKFKKGGRMVVIECDGKNVFRNAGKLKKKHVKMKRVSTTDMIHAWRENSAKDHESQINIWISQIKYEHYMDT